MTKIADVKGIVNDIRSRRDSWQLSTRRINLLTLQRLNMTDEIVFGIIYDRLTWQDYVSGPEADNHPRPIPGDIWIFGLTIGGLPCYLKFQDKPSGLILWLSVHATTKPLHFPYRSQQSKEV
ncbi:hypothetical protein [Levilactobacillus angrenensis]|uniref:DUF4258 domain-containing protein n=1 Tax=Levilactobacillus angrenensis TaxID=2486020 RepID=A0ABW1UBW2_9LACO|nr:hypothetical protein [Levilactobacillus angrenensis]